MAYIEQYPEILALLILVIGYFLSGWFADLAIRLIVRAEMRANRFLRTDVALTLTEHSQRIVRRSIFYFCVLLFLLVSIRILGLSTVSSYLDSVLLYVPQLIMGFLILLLGYVLSIAARNLTRSILPASQPQSLPVLVQWVIISITVLTGLDQMQVDVSFLTNLLILFVGILLSGLTLAFALGSRQLISNLLAARELGRYNIGDRVLINDLEGTICEIHQTGVVLQSESGLANLPSALFAERQVTILKDIDG